MQQPDHDLKIVTTAQRTPRSVISLVLVVGLHLIFIYALISGLAQNLVKKGLEEIKVATVEPPKVKPPPPPPPPMELPPPPFVPPPDVVIEAPAFVPPPIVTQSVQPVVVAPPRAPVSTPISIGRAHSCLQNYPPISQRNNEEGTTLMSFTVNVDGSVSDPSVAKSSGFQRLDEAALSCVLRWKYKPATQDGQPVAAQNQANVVWKLH